MSNLIVGLYAETFLHPGSGQNEGAIDLPVMREKVTAYPVVLGSSLKGALRAKARAEVDKGELDQAKLDQYFGKQEGAGGVLVGDARLLLLPIRSLTGSFKWVTCPHVINRLKRDVARCAIGVVGEKGKSDNRVNIKIPALQSGTYISQENQAALYLEERLLEPAEFKLDEALLGLIARLLPSDIDPQELGQRLVVVHDDDFAWFCNNSLPVHARNELDAESKSSKNLWYEETLPPESVLYATFLPRFDAKVLSDFQTDMLANNNYLQIGGNETVGQGWVAMTIAKSARQDSREVAA